MKVWPEKKKRVCPYVPLHWDNQAAADFAWVALSDGPLSNFADSFVNMSVAQNGIDETRTMLFRAINASSSKLVRDTIKAERKREAERQARQREIDRKAKGSVTRLPRGRRH